MKTITLTSLIIALNIMTLTPVISQEVGNAAPDFSIETLSGSTFKLADQQGKVIVIFFLGNECGNCKNVAPKVESDIYKKYKDRTDFSMIGIDTWSQSSAKLPGFKSSTDVTFPLGIDGSSIASNYGSTYDRLIVIDKDGTLVHKGTSGASSDFDNAATKIASALENTTTSINDGFKNKTAILLQNYPNPAKGETTIYLNLHENIYVDLNIYDITGKLVANLISKQIVIGEHSVKFNTTELKSGIYYYQLKAGDIVQTKRLMVQ